MFSVCYCFMHTLVFLVGAYSTWAFIPIMFMNWSVNLSDFSNSRALIATRSCRELVMCLVINLALFMLFFFLSVDHLGRSVIFFVVVEWYFYQWKVFLSLFFHKCICLYICASFFCVCALFSQKCAIAKMQSNVAQVCDVVHNTEFNAEA